MSRLLFIMTASVVPGPPTVELTRCVGYSCSPLVPYTAATLDAAVIAAGAAAVSTVAANTAVWTALILDLPSVAHVGEYGTFVGHPTVSTAAVKTGFGTLPPACTLGVSVVSRDQAEAMGMMFLQTFAIPAAYWSGGPPVTLETSKTGFLAVSMRGNMPATACHIVNGAKHVFSDAVFMPVGFAGIAGLPAYMSPPPAGINGVADLVTEQGFRDVVLAAGGPDLFAGPGFDANIINYLDPFIPNALVLSVANMVGDVLHNRLSQLVSSKGTAAVTFCGSMVQVGLSYFMFAVQNRMNALGLPVPFAHGIDCVLEEANRVRYAAFELEYAPHRP